MSARDFRGKVAIVGVGTAGCGEAHGYGEIELLARAAKIAVDDAGLVMRDIDGLCTANLYAATWPLKVLEYLKLRPKFVEGTNIGGSAFVAHLLPSMLALDAGFCDAVLVCYGSTQRTATVNRKEKRRARYLLDPLPFEYPYEPLDPSVPAMSVYPSGADFATNSVAMMPLPPGLFSTMTDCPSRSPSFWPTRRAVTSVPPPG